MKKQVIEEEKGQYESSNFESLKIGTEKFYTLNEFYEDKQVTVYDNLIESYRTELPSPRAKHSINLFKILKDCIGKDLTKFSMPVYFNEPISMLQKIWETMQHESLLSKAAKQKDSLLRLIYVSAFCIAQYSGTQNRWTKPFNPILGETFEFQTKKWRFCAEQVSHHPPISAGYAESKDYEMWTNTHVKTKFWGKYMEFVPIGKMNFRFKDNDHHFVWERPNSYAQNILLGHTYIDHNGESVIQNLNTNEKVVLKFSKLGFFENRNKIGKVDGTVSDSDGNKAYKINGNWT